MREGHRSGCPINPALEVLGNRRSLLILRDILFGGARGFREPLGSHERIASNILSHRLRALVEAGLLTRSGDPNRTQKGGLQADREGDRPRSGVRPDRRLGQSLAVGDRGSASVPGSWRRAAPLWERFMAELRQEHLGDGPVRPSVRAELEAAYQRVVAGMAND